MTEKLVEILEIWMPSTDKEGEAFHFQRQQWVKMVALIVNGNPIKLADGFLMERRHISQEEAENKDLV